MVYFYVYNRYQNKKSNISVFKTAQKIEINQIIVTVVGNYLKSSDKAHILKGMNIPQENADSYIDQRKKEEI